MKISKKKQSDLYSAISDSIMDIRMKLSHNDNFIKSPEYNKVDFEIAQTCDKIFENVKKALNIQ